MVVLGELQQVVQLDGDTWEWATTQQLEVHAYNQERRPPTGSTLRRVRLRVAGPDPPDGPMVKSVCNANRCVQSVRLRLLKMRLRGASIAEISLVTASGSVAERWRMAVTNADWSIDAMAEDLRN